MTRGKEFRRVLLMAALPLLFFISPFRLHAFPIQTIFADVNGDGHLEKVELFSEGTQNSIAVHFNRWNVSLYRFEAKISPFGRVLAGDFDHDGDLDLIWLSGGGPDSVLLHNDGQGNFELLDNTHLYASELHRTINSETSVGLQAQRYDVSACILNFSDHSKEFVIAAAWSGDSFVFHTLPIEAADHGVRASPVYRLAGRSPPLPSLA